MKYPQCLIGNTPSKDLLSIAMFVYQNVTDEQSGIHRLLKGYMPETTQFTQEIRSYS